MKALMLFALSVLLISCIGNYPSNDFNPRAEVYADFERTGLAFKIWDSLIDNLTALSDTNSSLAVVDIDKVHSFIPLVGFQNAELHLLKGEIFYHQDAYRKAICEYVMFDSLLGFASPTGSVAKACAYSKLKKIDSAYICLSRATSKDPYCLWTLGNYYEIVGKRDSAIFCYERLFSKDSISYKFCKDRATALKQPNTALFTELIYKKRKKTSLVMLAGIKKSF